ncbi:MAG TPA: sulfatase-like hydrolase/transferase [Stellaceae bacterium]|nr:sulfatase-like hydrolase/transferase [Stellaceae bacterium]
MPNLVLFMADQLRADALGCFGNPLARTPVLDAVAASGARLSAHMTPNQICSPSRASLFSGLYARNHGLVHNGIALRDDIGLLPHALARAGFRTHGIGKFHFQPILAPAAFRMPESNAFWGLPESTGWRGPYYGFQTAEFVIGESAAVTVAGHYARWLEATDPDAVEFYRRERAVAQPPADLDEVWKCAVPEHLHYNRWIADRACAFLADQRRESFFLFVSFPDPHHPFTPPRPWCDMFDPAEVPAPKMVPGELLQMPDYIAGSGVVDQGAEEGHKSYLDFLLSPGASREQGFMTTVDRISDATLRLAIAHTYGSVAMIDDCIGRVLGALRSSGCADDTFVVFTSDHGEFLGDHGLLRKGPPPYRQLLNVPMLIAGPGIDPITIDTLTSHVDIRATMLELLGVAGAAGDGMSFGSLLRGETGVGRDAVWAEYHPRVAAEQYNQTLITPDWRITLYPRRPIWGELFDRRADPGEHRNLFHEPEFRSARDRLIERLQREWPPAPDAGGERIAIY